MTSRERMQIITSLTSIAIAIIALFNTQTRLETVEDKTSKAGTGESKSVTIDLETAKFAYELIRPTINTISDDVQNLKFEMLKIKSKSSGEEEIEQTINPVDCGVPEQSAVDAGMTNITPIQIIPTVEPAPPAPPLVLPEYMQQQIFVPKLPPFEELIETK